MKELSKEQIEELTFLAIRDFNLRVDGLSYEQILKDEGIRRIQ